MKQEHKHNWIPISKAVDVFVDERCHFVCECGKHKIKKMRLIT